jgi:putative endonuclease
MHYVYIIYTPAFDKYYIGESVNAVNRTEEHNSGFYHNASTSFTTDWELALQLQLETRSQAIKVERYIKSMKSKTFIRKLLSDESFFSNFRDIVRQKLQIEIL